MIHHNYCKFKRRAGNDASVVVAPMATAVFIILSAFVSATTGQVYCLKDVDCMHNQYCYSISNMCVNYTRCSRYNRAEGSTPARQANQCGPCLPNYALGENTNREKADSCLKVQKVEGTDQQTSTSLTWPIIFSIFLICFFVSAVIGYLTHRLCKIKKICCYKPEDLPEKPALPMLQNTNIDASAPPLPFLRNNNNYGNSEEERLPLSSIGEQYGNIKIDSYKPVQAQPFRSPDWVNLDPNYNPGDIVQAVTSIQQITPDNTAAANDEETLLSVWRPTEQPSLPVPNRPFAINMENDENTTNTALDNARACPSSPHSEERWHQSSAGGRQYNSQGASTSNSENNNGSGNGNGNGNGNANAHSAYIISQINVSFSTENSSGGGN